MRRRIFDETLRHWDQLSFYQRFEQIIVLLLGLVISVVIIAAMYELLRTTFDLLRFRMLDPMRADVFEAVFGMIMIVLIALEFNHTILGHMERGVSIIQVRAVVLIALLAVLRKFLVIEIGKTDAILLLALSVATVALGAVYWAVREQEKSMRADRPHRTSTDSVSGE